MTPLFPKNEHCSSKRRERRWRQRDCDKELRALMREYDRLSLAVWTAPVIELEQPYQRGWFREFRLSDRAKRKANADQMQNLLRAVNHRQYCRRGDFTFLCREKKRLMPLVHRLRRPHLWQILREGLDPLLFKYFRHIGSGTVLSRRHVREWTGRRWNGRLEVICPESFRQATEPWIITHQRVDLPETKARIAEIDELLVESAGWERWQRIRGRTVSGRHSYDRLSFSEKKEQLTASEIHKDYEACLSTQPPPLPLRFPEVEATEGTTNIVPFDFTELSFPTHLTNAA